MPGRQRSKGDGVLKLRDADNFRRTLAGLCLIVAPLAFVVSEAAYGLYFSQ